MLGMCDGAVLIFFLCVAPDAFANREGDRRAELENMSRYDMIFAIANAGAMC